jgi:glutamyl-tRNA synthetase
MNELRLSVLRHALRNAVLHGGKALPEAVLGKVLAECPEIRQRLEEVRRLVEEVVSEVNLLTLEQQKAKLAEVGEPLLKRVERRGLPELPQVEGRVVTRFAPNPNGPLHLGHVRAALLSYEYAKKYGGKFILRFEDTNPRNALSEMYELIRKDLAWLGIVWDEEYYQSDRLELYYSYARKLVEEGKAYVCTCSAEVFGKLRDAGQACPCRELPAWEHQKRWEGMLTGQYPEEGAVLRIKTDLSHPNPAVRDWPAMRIVDYPHPRTGTRYKVWPLYNFSVSIDDHEMGVTHILRGKEHEVNEERQRFLYQHLGWKYPVSIQYGRLMLEGVELSKTKIMEGVRAGTYTGVDDVRLATIASLRRRGYQPEAIKETLLGVGLTLVDSHLSWETLASHNRKILDPKVNRYFFVPNPVEFRVREVPEVKEVRVRLHPIFKERGERRIPVDWTGGVVRVRIPKKDAERLKVGEVFRLMGFMNVKVIGEGEGEFAGFELSPSVPKVQWVSEPSIEATTIKPDGLERGRVEPAILEEKNDLVQFERYGFVRIEQLHPLVAVYAHS